MSPVTLALTPATLAMIRGRPLKPVPVIVILEVRPATTAPMTRMAFRGSTNVTFVAADEAGWWVVSPAFVEVTVHAPALRAVNSFPDTLQPADDPAARVQVTAPVPVPPAIESLSVVPTLPLSVLTVTVAWGVPTAVVCAAVVSVLVESVAVSTQVPVTLMVRALKVATPATPMTDVVPPRVHVDVITIVSVDPVPVVTTLPLTSSTETANVGTTELAVVTLAGGATEKATCVGAPARTFTVVLEPVARVLVMSVATNTQAVPVLMVTVVNVATPPTAVAVKVPDSVHDDVRTTPSVDPVPEVIGTPLLSSTETAKGARTLPATALVGGSVENPSFVGVFEATFTGATATVKPVSPAVVSDAVKVQLEVPAVKVTPVKVATPVPATALAATLKVHPADDVTTIVSPDPVPVALTFPYWSSTETLNVPIATPIVAAVGGAVEKASLTAAAGVTVIAGLVTVVTPPVETSAAVSVQFVPVVMVTALNVAIPATAATDVVPVSVQFEVMAMVSVEPGPDVITAGVLSSTETPKLVSGDPALAVVGGNVE